MRDKSIQLFCLFICLLYPFSGFSESIHRIKVWENRMYAIPFAELSKIGIDTTTSVFNQVELSSVHGETSYTIHNNTLYFYGAKMDAELDKKLWGFYGESLSNPFASMYIDTAYYYLKLKTSSTSFPILQEYNANVVEGLIQASKRIDFREVYAHGKLSFIYASTSTISEAEGWMSNPITLQNSRSIQVSSDHVAQGQSYRILTKICGASDAVASGNNNHHIQLLWNNQVVKDTLWSGYECIDLSFTSNTISNQNTLLVQHVNDLGLNVDDVVLAYVTIDAPVNSSALQSDYQYSSDKAISFSATTPFWMYDEEHHRYYISKEQNGLSRLTFSNPSSDFVFYLDTEVQVKTLESLNVDINLSEFRDYIIFYPPEYQSSALSFQTHKASIGKTVHLLNLDEVYAQYTHGSPHPLAITLCLEAYTNAYKHVVLWGKGYAFTGNYATFPWEKDKVPNIGFPSSDQLYISGANTPISGKTIGRIPINSNQEGLVYVDKLSSFEQNKPELNAKRILQLTGGRTTNEQVIFNSLTNGFNTILKDTLLGADIINLQKSSSEAISSTFKQRIQEEFDKGLILCSFFGHGSNVLTEIELGKASEYNNRLYPFIIINGCDAGNPNIDTCTLATFITRANGGGIASLGTSDVGFSGYLSSFTETLFKVLYQDTTQRTLGEGVQESIKRSYQSSDPLNSIHAYQYFLMGDPGLELFKPIYPNYKASILDASLTNQQINTKVTVQNIGAFRKDSVLCRLSLIQSNGTVLMRDSIQIKGMALKDTITLQSPLFTSPTSTNAELKLELNSLNFEIESPRFQLSENLNLNASNVSLVYPYPNQVVEPETQLIVEIKGKVNTQTIPIELDTLSSFDSPYLIQAQIPVNAIRSAIELKNLVESKHYVRVASSPITSSFYVEKNSPWNFKTQLSKDFETYLGQGVKKTNSELAFESKFKSIRIFNSGTQGTQSPQIRIDNLLAIFGLNLTTELAFIAFKAPTLDRINSFSKYELAGNTPDFMGDANGKSGVLVFSTLPEAQDSLIQYLNRLPLNSYVFCISGKQFDPNQLSNALKQEFTKMNWNALNQFNNGEAFLGFYDVARKLAKVSTGLGNLELGQAIEGRQNEGTLTGNTVHFIDSIQRISYTSNPIQGGISNLELFSANQKLLQVPLSSDTIINIVSEEFQLRFKLSSPDSALIAQNQIVYLKAKLKEDYTLNSNTSILQSFQGNILYDSLLLSNLTQLYAEDSVLVQVQISQGTQSIWKDTLAARPNQWHKHLLNTNLSPNTYTLQYTLIHADANPQNNTLKKTLKIEKDALSPDVQCWLDGRLYVNKDIISTQSEWKIVCKKPYAFQLDTVQSFVKILDAQSQTVQTISLSTLQGTENEYEVRFKTDANLKDGTYSLVYQWMDTKGNAIENQQNPLEFELISKTMISNVFPYPNPFSDKMFYVFTLTGSIPDVFFVDIYTLRGVKVKRMDLLNDPTLKIGHNKSALYWDGKDDVGDKLGRGVYFYTITAKKGNQDIPIYDTQTGKYFKNNTGKLYLLN
jgi:hypothetical protein